MYRPHCLALRGQFWETETEGRKQVRTAPSRGSFNAPVLAGFPRRAAPHSHSRQCQETAERWQRSRAKPSRSPGPLRTPAMWCGSWTGRLLLAAGWGWGGNGFPWRCERRKEKRNRHKTTHFTHFKHIKQQKPSFRKEQLYNTILTSRKLTYVHIYLTHLCADLCIWTSDLEL